MSLIMRIQESIRLDLCLIQHQTIISFIHQNMILPFMEVLQAIPFMEVSEMILLMVMLGMIHLVVEQVQTVSTVAQELIPSAMTFSPNLAMIFYLPIMLIAMIVKGLWLIYKQALQPVKPFMIAIPVMSLRVKFLKILLIHSVA